MLSLSGKRGVKLIGDFKQLRFLIEVLIAI